MKGAYTKGSAIGSPSAAAASLMAEYGLENTVIPATGKNLTITKKDVQQYIKANGIEQPATAPGSEEEE